MYIFIISIFLLVMIIYRQVSLNLPKVDDIDEITTEDMIIHDMNNDDDTYDIGVINFNE